MWLFRRISVKSMFVNNENSKRSWIEVPLLDEYGDVRLTAGVASYMNLMVGSDPKENRLRSHQVSSATS